MQQIKIEKSKNFNYQEEAESITVLANLGQSHPEKEKEMVQETGTVNELIKSFEENQITNGSNPEPTEPKPLSEPENGPPSKALELITKYLDDPDKQSEVSNEQTPGLETQPEKSNIDKTEERIIKKETSPKILITRQTSTSSLEEAFIRRLQERHYKVAHILLIFSCWPFAKQKN